MIIEPEDIVALNAVKPVPQQIAGLAHWLRADDIAPADRAGDLVSAWRCKVSATNNCVEATNKPAFQAANPWFNGHASVNFDGVNDRLVSGTSSALAAALSGSDVPFTVFLMIRNPAKIASGDKILWSLCSGSSANRHGLRFTVGSNQFFHRTWRITSDNVARNGDANLTDTSPIIRCEAFSGTTIKQFLVGYSDNPDNDMVVEQYAPNHDGANPPPAAATMDTASITFDRLSIGCEASPTPTAFAAIEVAEVIVYGRELSEAERVRVMSYLWGRYAPPFSAPASIPGLIHHWDCSLLAANPSDDVAELPDQVAGGKSFDQNTQANRPICQLHPNGRKILRFDGSGHYMTSGVAADWNVLHNATGHSVAIVFRVRNADDNALHPLLDTVVDDLGGERGMGLYYDDSGTNRCLRQLSGTGVAAVLNHTSSADLLRPQEWQVAGRQYWPTIPSTEFNFELFLNGQIYASVDQSTAPSASDATNALTLGALANGTSPAAIEVAEIVIFDRPIGRYAWRKLGEYFSEKWWAQHHSLVGGNGRGGDRNDNSDGGNSRHRGFPVATRDSTGSLLAVWARDTQHTFTAAAKVVMAQSATGVGRWSPERVLVETVSPPPYKAFDGCILRKQVAPHAGRILLTWDEADTISDSSERGTQVMWSDDDGRTWSTPQDIDQDQPLVYSRSGSCHQILELPTGELLFFHSGIVAGQSSWLRSLVRRSSDGGETIGPAVQIAPVGTPTLGDYNETCCVRIPSTGTLAAMVRIDDPGVPQYFHFTLVKSYDDGATWSAEADFGAASGAPNMFVDENDGVYIFYRGRSGGLNNKFVWRYTTDIEAEPVVWTPERRAEWSADYSDMIYAYPFANADGGFGLIYGMEDGADGDIFCVPHWHTVPP